MVPKSRRKVDFCKASIDKYIDVVKNKNLPYKDLKHRIVNGLYGESNTYNRYDKYVLARRYALNLHSWFYHGTIECRLMNGTIDPATIIKWGKTWLAIMDFSLDMNSDKIDIIGEMESYDALINIINNDPELKSFIDTKQNEWK
jgi:hypothetical protein